MKAIVILSVLGLVLSGCRMPNGSEPGIVDRVVMPTGECQPALVNTIKTVIVINDDAKVSTPIRYTDPEVYFNDSRLWGVKELKKWEIDKGYIVRMYRPSENRIVVRYTVGFNTVGKAEFHKQNGNWVMTACDLSPELIKRDNRLLHSLKPNSIAKKRN